MEFIDGKTTAVVVLFFTSHWLSHIVFLQYKQAEVVLWGLLGTIVKKHYRKTVRMTRPPPAIHKTNHTDSAAVLYYFTPGQLRRAWTWKTFTRKSQNASFNKHNSVQNLSAPSIWLQHETMPKKPNNKILLLAKYRFKGQSRLIQGVEIDLQKPVAFHSFFFLFKHLKSSAMEAQAPA